MLRATFAYDVRHVARVLCKCCAHLPREESATRDVTFGPSVKGVLHSNQVKGVLHSNHQVTDISHFVSCRVQSGVLPMRLPARKISEMP
jgi:hypothetical protein